MKNNQEEIDDVNSQGDAEIESPAQDQGHGFDNPNFNLLNLTVAEGVHNLFQDNTVNEANQAQGGGVLQENTVNHENLAQNRGDPQDDTVNHEVPVPVPAQGHDVLQYNPVNHLGRAQGIMYGIQPNNQDQNNLLDQYNRARNQNLVELRELLKNLIENVENERKYLESLKVKKADLKRKISNKEVLINIITNE
ncbi:hypothetical protein H8356DRAFT_1708704 [Neocallimastix lanati (nom. inval.)]|uniref:Uncharacterized protein n=1 Tax=Neocallimastix californiae TaxID=1754190 RepID=A0A1Y2D4K3_9FUNG|nr:hypothetical protein H8356DRAFT_1708704 [Neocallimastix sp. JGI-2020a]ORY54239.1 hypothetical protein LY90DRAFT_278941 [Neocallimastix californiae]|eukprot:ORY54239.1 hypothetical protein LY90DRAFT_278941 [Neocallimastix californiae]